MAAEQQPVCGQPFLRAFVSGAEAASDGRGEEFCTGAENKSSPAGDLSVCLARLWTFGCGGAGGCGVHTARCGGHSPSLSRGPFFLRCIFQWHP